MDTSVSSIDWEAEVAALLTDLSDAQDELMEVLSLKRDCMARADLQGIRALSPREDGLACRLQECQDRRKKLLELAAQAGRPSSSIRQLAATMPAGARDKVGRQVKDVSSKLRMLQHHSLCNWVLAQRSVLHLSQLLEIVATGGRIRPTYDKGESAHSRGALVDREV